MDGLGPSPYTHTHIYGYVCTTKHYSCCRRCLYYDDDDYYYFNLISKPEILDIFACIFFACAYGSGCSSGGSIQYIVFGIINFRVTTRYNVRQGHFTYWPVAVRISVNNDKGEWLGNYPAARNRVQIHFGWVHSRHHYRHRCFPVIGKCELNGNLFWRLASFMSSSAGHYAVPQRNYRVLCTAINLSHPLGEIIWVVWLARRGWWWAACMWFHCGVTYNYIAELMMGQFLMLDGTREIETLNLRDKSREQINDRKQKQCC